MLYFLHMPHSPEFLEEVANSQDVFIWEAPAYEQVKRGPKWYLWMAGVVALFAIYAIATGNYLFAFIIFLTAIILVLAGNEPPRRVLVQMGTNGIVIDGSLILYDQINNFSIIYHPPHTKVLYLEPSGVMKGRLRVSLEDEDPVEIRALLKRYVTENLDLREEHFSDIVGRLLKI